MPVGHPTDCLTFAAVPWRMVEEVGGFGHLLSAGNFRVASEMTGPKPDQEGHHLGLSLIHI